MNQVKKFNCVLTEFFEKHDLNSASSTSNNTYEFYVDGTNVHCCAQGEHLVIHSSLGTIPEDRLTAQTVLKNLLQLSLLNSETFGFVLSLDEQGNLRISHRLALNHCLLSDFEYAIEELLGHLEEYGKQLSEQDQDTYVDNTMFNIMSVV